MLDSPVYAGHAVLEDSLDREAIRARLKRFLVVIIDTKGPKAVARDLTAMGWPYPEGTVRTWRGEKNPPPDVVFALSAKYGVSIDEYVTGMALEVAFGDRVQRNSRDIAWLKDRYVQLAVRLGHDDLLGPMPSEEVSEDRQAEEA